MDMNSTLARIATGFAVKAAGAALAIYVAAQVYAYVTHVFGAASAIAQHLG